MVKPTAKSSEITEIASKPTEGQLTITRLMRSPDAILFLQFLRQYSNTFAQGAKQTKLAEFLVHLPPPQSSQQPTKQKTNCK